MYTFRERKKFKIMDKNLKTSFYKQQIFIEKTRTFYVKRGESTSPGICDFCVRQFMLFSIIRPLSRFLAFSFYLLSYPRQDGMTREKEEDRMGQKKRELHELLYAEIGNSGTIRLTAGFRAIVKKKNFLVLIIIFLRA